MIGIRDIIRDKLNKSIETKVLASVVLGALAVVGISTTCMLYIKAKNTELVGLTTARVVAQQAASVRKYYANEVVPRAKKAGMQVDFDFDQRDNTLPSPATLTKVLGEEIGKLYPGSKIRLYSHLPFQHRAGSETYDTFEKEALAAVEKDPKQPYARLETVDGRLSMRYAIADVMQSSCVECHNNHPQSPKTDWKEGDVRGAVEVIVPVDEAAAGLRAGTLTLVLLSIVSLALLAGAIVLVLRRTVVNPLQSLAATAKRISMGDFTARADTSGEDEIAQTAASFNQMLDHTLALVQSQEERDDLNTSIQTLRHEVANVADGDLTVTAAVSDDATGAIAESFNQMVAQLRTILMQVQETSMQVSTSANEVQVTAEHLATGSDTQAAQIVDSSAAIDEMAVSIQQVSDNAALSANVAEQALSNAQRGAQAVQNTIQGMQRIRDQVQATAQRIQTLGEHSQAIGESVQLINDIADRTSVLALNASIEAALAGEAGLGFAVVAQEVERLAERSAEATRQIGHVVQLVQEEAKAAMAAMQSSQREVQSGAQVAAQAGQALQEIEQVAARLAELSQSISMASRQQARGSEGLARAMNEIADVTQQTAAGTKQAAVSISNLAVLADTLRGSVSTFKLPETSNGNGPRRR